MDIRIVCGIPDGKRRDISALIYSVDPVIFRRIFGKDALNILEASLNDKMIFVAMIEDKVAGVVGIASKEERSLNVTPAVVLKYRGIKFLKSLLLWQLIKSMPGKGDRFIDFIAVESRYRGRGIGTKLLNRAISTKQTSVYQKRI